MRFDFSLYPVRNRGFSEKAMTLLDPEPRALLTGILEIALIETGNSKARENWQNAQLRNLLKHASQRSGFWQRRIGSKQRSLAFLPVLTRHELVDQVASEGSLLGPQDGLRTYTNATSGSSGVPVHFFFSEWNARYNDIRNAVQFFMEGRDLSRNVTMVWQGYNKIGFSVEKKASWMGSLAPLIKSGSYKHIEYLNPNMKELVKELVKELRKEDVGYLVCNPRLLEGIFDSYDPVVLKETNTVMWISRAERVDQHLRQTLADLAIPSRSNYSSEEVGAIGFECESFPGHFHVATSNVIVELADESHEVDGSRLGKVLVTHLHSYATPFIRYDLGDLACLRASCPCGHEGPTIYNLQGRLSSLIRHRDGSRTAVLFRGNELAALAKFSEYRIRQTELEKLVIEIGGRSDLTVDEITAFTTFLRTHAGQHFQIEVIPRERIDWGQSRKRLGFLCEVA